MRTNEINPANLADSLLQRSAILFLAGFCLILLQFFMIREMSAMLAGTELVIFLITIAYFTGYSIGYGFSGYFTSERLRLFALLFWMIHFTLPFSLRYFMGAFYGSMSAFVFLAFMFFSAFLLSSFYSVLALLVLQRPASAIHRLIHG